MAGIYEAQAVTEGGTYRAYAMIDDTIAITEDGVDGIIDFVQLDPNAPANNAPEYMLQVLISWVCEFRRGEQLLKAVLSRRH